MEIGPASTSLLQAAGVAHLITVTGDVSFLTGRTFDQLLGAASEPAWVAAFALRTTSYQRIADTLAEHA